MNVDTGELVRFAHLIAPETKNLFTPIPDTLAKDATEALGDSDRVTIDLKSETPLARFAAEQRAVKHNKARRRMAKKSRRANRRKS